MTPKLLIAALAASLAVSLGPAAADPIELQWWHAMTAINADAVNKIATDYNAAQPDYKIVPVYKGSYPETMTAAIAAFRAGNPPHIVQVFEVGTATMMGAKGAVKPVYQLMADLGEMRHLMRDDIVYDRLRCQDEPPAEREIAGRRAAAPAAGRVAHRNPRHPFVDACGKAAGAARQLLPGQPGEMVAHPAGDMRRVAAHPDLAIGDRHRRRRGIVLAADPVRYPEHRHDGALGKRDRSRQRAEPGGDPAALRRQKPQPVLGWNAIRQHQLDRPRGGVHLEQQAPGARIDPNRQGRADVERHGAAPEILDRSGRNRAAARQPHQPPLPLR